MIRDLSGDTVQGKRVILYGAGIDGQRILAGCALSGLSVAYFCDRNLAGKEVEHIPVIAPEELPKDDDIAVVIGSGKYCGEIYRGLKNWGLSDDRIFSAVQMYRKGCHNNGLGAHDYEGALRQFFSAMAGDIYFPSLDLVVTERCTLRCRDCSNLMQYYIQPEDCDSQTVLDAFQRLLQIVEGIGEVRILGGEPFLNQPLLYSILTRYREESKVECFCIVTNGTVPVQGSLISVLCHEKVRVSCSDYVAASSRRKGLQSLETAGVSCALMTDSNDWLDYGKLKHYDYPVAVYQRLYDGCTNRRYCNTLFQGRLYLCPRAAHGEQIRGIPHCDADSVNLLSGEAENLREQLLQLLTRKSYIKACEYCDWLHGGLVPKAVQSREPLPYTSL